MKHWIKCKVLFDIIISFYSSQKNIFWNHVRTVSCLCSICPLAITSTAISVIIRNALIIVTVCRILYNFTIYPPSSYLLSDPPTSCSRTFTCNSGSTIAGSHQSGLQFWAHHGWPSHGFGTADIGTFAVFQNLESENDQEIPKSQTADKLMAPRGRATNSHATITRYQEDKLSKATSSFFPIKMISKLEWT